MPPNHHEEIGARLDRLVQQINASRPRRHQGPGRPSQGIRAGYLRTEIYLPPDIRDALDRLANRREAQTGRSTCRADVVREALAAYIQEHLPEAGG
jgi:predicted transcriptional regulator